MNYELNVLEDFLSTYKKQHPHDESTIGFRQSVSFLQREVERIMQVLMQQAILFESEEHLQRYIRYHQYALVRLMDQVTEDIHSPGKNAFIQSLEQLHAFLEHHFRSALDRETKAPLSCINTAIGLLQPRYDILQIRLQENKVDAQLIDLLFHSFNRMKHSSAKRKITYHNIAYAKEVQQQLEHWLEQQSTADTNDRLRRFLCYLNYNSTGVFAYFMHHFDRQLKTAETRADRIEQLSFLFKEINQIQIRPGIRYNTAAPSLVSQLTGYLTEEIDHLQRVQILIGLPSATPDKMNMSFKLMLELSVSQLSFLIRLLTETKVVRNINISETLRFFSRFSTTRKSENISYDSLRAKYYNVESAARLSIRNLLNNMVKYIDQHT